MSYQSPIGRPRTCKIKPGVDIQVLRKFVKIPGSFSYLTLQQLDIVEKNIDFLYLTYDQGERTKQNAIKSLELVKNRLINKQFVLKQPWPTFRQLWTQLFPSQIKSKHLNNKGNNKQECLLAKNYLKYEYPSSD